MLHANVVSAPVNLRNTYSQQWNLSIQRQLSSGLTLDVAYVGNRATRVQQTILINDPAPGAGAIQGRPYQLWGTINMGSWGGSQHYNALQVKLQSREWHGTSYQRRRSTSAAWRAVEGGRRAFDPKPPLQRTRTCRPNRLPTR